jgi:hypothetical protein
MRRRPQRFDIAHFDDLRDSFRALISSARVSTPKSLKAGAFGVDILDPDDSIFDIHVESDFVEQVDVLAEFPCDAVDGLDVRDFVDMPGQAARTDTGWAAPVPRQQLVEPVDRMIGNARQHVGEPGPRIDTIHLRCIFRPRNYAERVCFPKITRYRRVIGSA